MITYKNRTLALVFVLSMAALLVATLISQAVLTPAL